LFKEKEELLHIERSGRSAIKVKHVFDDKDSHFLDVRKYYINDDGEWAPEKKGIMLRLDEAKQVGEVLMQQ